MSSDLTQRAMQSYQVLFDALHSLIIEGKQPGDPAKPELTDPDVREVFSQIEDIRRFILALASGDLDFNIQMQGELGDALKTVQARLRQSNNPAAHPKQQIKPLRASPAYDGMITNFRQSLEELEASTAAGLDRHAGSTRPARSMTRETYRKLQSQMQENASLQARLREEAIRDPLTGCFNRRYLDETIRREFSRGQREGYPISLVMADLDRFKDINDRYGHQAGDAVLQSLGILLRGHTRLGDIVCRYGGDEFLIVLPNMKQTDAIARAESWKQALNQSEIYFGNTRLNPTLSMGIAAAPQHGRNNDQVVKAADEALYRAKGAGRNCIVAR